MHGRKYRNAARTCDVVFANSRVHGRRLRRARSTSRSSGCSSRIPGIGADFSADGPASDLGAPYLLTVATLEPRKNLGTLVDAFALLADTDLSLVVVGGQGWGEQPQLDRPGIVRLGRVTDEELARLYRGAQAVVYPSRFEGFGMPITEAMASRRTRRRLGARVDGRGVRAMPRSAPTPRARRRSPRRSAKRSRGATSCARKGIEHARAFSWRRTGEVFLEGYERFA